jgi:hypothetical protein
MAVLDLLIQVADGDDEGIRQLYEQLSESGIVY